MRLLGLRIVACQPAAYRVVMHDDRLNRRSFLRATPAMLTAMVTGRVIDRIGADEAAVSPPVIGRSRVVSRGRPELASLQLGERQSLRLMQFTDNHFFCGVAAGLTATPADAKTELDWHSYVQIYKPDVLVVTGDLWHDNPGGRGIATLEHAVTRLEELEVPWAFCWGNHDLLDDYQEGHDRLESARNSLYRGRASHGDYWVDIKTGSGQGSKLAARLWLLNSNRYGLTEWQLNWLRRARRALPQDPATVVPAFAFYHIPLLQQKTLHQPNVTRGVFLEEVCHEKEEGRAAPVLADDSKLLACFCGHDHVNDYAVRSGELDLVYGRATGHAGYGGESLRKGAKLIELDLVTQAYTSVTVFADGTREI